MLKISTNGKSVGLVTKSEDMEDGGDADDGGDEGLPSESVGDEGEAPAGESHASLKDLLGEVEARESPTNEKSDLSWRAERFGIDESLGKGPLPDRAPANSGERSGQQDSPKSGRWYGSISASGGIMGAFGLALGGSAGVELAAYDTTSASFAGGGFLPTAGIGFYASPFGPGVNLGYSIASPGSSAACFRQVNAILPIVTFAVNMDLRSNQFTQFSISLSGSVGLGIIGGVFCGASMESHPIKDIPDILTQKVVEEFGGDPLIGLVNRLYQGF